MELNYFNDQISKGENHFSITLNRGVGSKSIA